VLDLKIYSSKRFLHFGAAANNPSIAAADLEGNCKTQCEGDVCIKFSMGTEGELITTLVSAFRLQEIEQYVCYRGNEMQLMMYAYLIALQGLTVNCILLHIAIERK
jgi:hypothetical protein